MKNCGPFRRKGMEAYIARYSKPRDKVIYDSTLVKRFSVVGIDIPEAPASIYEPKQMFESLDKFSKAPDFKKNEFVEEAISEAFLRFGHKRHLRKLSPLKNEKEVFNRTKLNKSAGIYRVSKELAWIDAVARAEQVLAGLKKPNPCIALARTQRGGKTRLVWGYPLDVNYLEGYFGYPLIDNFSEIRTPITYSLKKYEIGGRLYSTLKGRNCVSLDFSKFDASVPKELILVAFRILKTWFDLDGAQEKHWELIVNYFLYTPIVMIDGNLYTGKKHGIPSGSLFTQLIGSIVNYIVITSALKRFNHLSHWRAIHVLGDDSIFSTNKDVCLSRFAEYFQTLGFKLNIKKSLVSNHMKGVHYLGFTWIQGKPNKTFEAIVSSLTQPESWRKKEKEPFSEKARASRMIMEMLTLTIDKDTWYNVRKVFNWPSVREILYLTPEEGGVTGYTKFAAEYFDSEPKIFRNVAGAIWE